jgi:SAM-dependent methyltransferase
VTNRHPGWNGALSARRNRQLGNPRVIGSVARRIARRAYLSFRQGVDTLQLAPDEYRAVQCRGDRLEYLSPRLMIMSTLVYLMPIAGRHLQAGTDIAVLDAGARDGWTVSLFNQLGYTNVVGVELIEQLADHAKEQGRNVVRGDLHNLPFDSASFELVFCRHTLEHVMEPMKAMSELVRVCKPGGLVLITLPIERKAHGKHTTAIPNLRVLKNLALDAGKGSIEVLQLARSASTKVIIPDGDEALLLMRKADVVTS